MQQSLADHLIHMEKYVASQTEILLPPSGSINLDLTDSKKIEKFKIDIRRARIDLKKGTNQMRTRQTIILLRLDFGGAPHRNPDGQEINCPHLHFYKEGYEDRWAYSLSEKGFPSIKNFERTVEDFLIYCNVANIPPINTGLFP